MVNNNKNKNYLLRKRIKNAKRLVFIFFNYLRKSIKVKKLKIKTKLIIKFIYKIKY